jgi:hypothetical protein
MLLNGEKLEMSGPAWHLPAALTGAGRKNDGGVVLPALHVAFAIFPAAGASDCI